VSEDGGGSSKPRRRKNRDRKGADPAASSPLPDGRGSEDVSEAGGAAEPSPEPEPQDDRGDIPAFALKFPRDPALDALVAAFEAGDYARVRREGPELARSTENDEVRRAAREIVRRLDPDPIAVYMLMAAAALLVFLAGWYWSHPHSP
jgi:hypothetical protein